ncbi:hypothetical protein IEQ34_011305 [Dendrobium chrysotoxum]|uniref:Uncharacterized protein n=1 Tax=Dendrobium chrysotoxum TaxID=161865 RepID=A0AAV7GXE5_DENCH|nr:hypothetical protein IEQ34_011305 [Dendrobium chrysotoxum]
MVDKWWDGATTKVDECDKLIAATTKTNNDIAGDGGKADQNDPGCLSWATKISMHDTRSPLKFKMPHLESYRGRANPTYHFANFESMMLLMGINYPLKC